MNMKTLALAAALALNVQAASAAEIKPLNSVAMEVNAGIITYGDINRTILALKSRPGNQGIPDAELIQAAKQQMLERTLMTEAAREQGIKATNADIDAELQRRAQLGGISVAALYEQAARLGWPRSQFRLEVAKDLVLERMMSNIDDGVKISDAQVDAAVAQAQKEGKLPQGTPYTVYQVRRILINKSQLVSPTAVTNSLNNIAQAARQGTDFSAMAARYSQEPAAAQGGLVELTDESEPAKVEEVLKTLQPGQISVPLQTARNWQLIQMVGTRVESNPQKTAREAVRRQMLNQERQQALQQFIGQLQQSAVVREF